MCKSFRPGGADKTRRGSTPGIEPGTSCMLDVPEAGIIPLDQVDSLASGCEFCFINVFVRIVYVIMPPSLVFPV